jgi:hypothetical protein
MSSFEFSSEFYSFQFQTHREMNREWERKMEGRSYHFDRVEGKVFPLFTRSLATFELKSFIFLFFQKKIKKFFDENGVLNECHLSLSEICFLSSCHFHSLLLVSQWLNKNCSLSQKLYSHTVPFVSALVCSTKFIHFWYIFFAHKEEEKWKAHISHNRTFIFIT